MTRSDTPTTTAPGAAHLIQGDALALPLPDNFIHCVVTSIPYWGLRSYGTTPRVWGGNFACAHEWGDSVSSRRTLSPSTSSTLCGNGHVGGGPKIHTISDRSASSAFCSHCGGWRGEYGSEPNPELFVANTVQVFREVRRVLRADGTLWLNIGDSYASHGSKAAGKELNYMGDSANERKARSAPAGLKAKDLCGIPWRVAFALQADGWYLRDCIIWHKPNPMPSSVTDRTTTAHEYVFLLTKNAKYFYDADAIREPITSTGGASFGKQNHATDGTGAASRKLADPFQRNNPLGRNKRSVWTISTHSFPGAHFATFPPRLVEPCVKAGTSERGCCPACGAPWKRVVIRSVELLSNSAKAGNIPDGKRREESQVRDGHDIRMGNTSRVTTTGWTPTCKCSAGEPVPCRVLDNFSGAATTALVARDLGRIGIGVELNHAYCLIARDRRNAGPVLKRPKRVKPKPVRCVEPSIKPGQGDQLLFNGPSYATEATK